MAASQVPTALGLPQSPPASSTPWPLPGPLPVLPSLPCFLGRVGSSSLCFSGHSSPKSSNCTPYPLCTQVARKSSKRFAHAACSSTLCRPPGAKAKAQAHSSSVSKSCRISDDDFLGKPLLTPFGASRLTNQMNHTFNSLKTSSRFDIINTSSEAFYNETKDTT
ncbi:hypothetical protein JMJ77_0015427 [Colletotrichum scovillei]|uniref:Uncharacterized protein n=1 Tax=Colletotrichum scovillei TaxID=1209932 RepID=A0A9P7UAG5_9PEZI|nr:hypothetical protein JMJ77_0015427 [Colletotrichum scovillei]KAG7057026.1 hypothetical protein JMJ78_0000810 [Colletotrichum scovillei]KAG7066982.1 hypothetical protein JMJ76_0000827 [Colletotrichum scovillei]